MLTQSHFYAPAEGNKHGTKAKTIDMSSDPAESADEYTLPKDNSTSYNQHNLSSLPSVVKSETVKMSNISIKNPVKMRKQFNDFFGKRNNIQLALNSNESKGHSSLRQ